MKGIIIKRERSGKWFAKYFQVEPRLLPKTERTIGIDVRIRHFLTDSEKKQVENPRFYERTLEQIRREAVNEEERLARAHEKLANQRNDFLHKLSRFYINDLIAMEHLNIYRLGGKILDTSWGKFMFSYKG